MRVGCLYCVRGIGEITWRTSGRIHGGTTQPGSRLKSAALIRRHRILLPLIGAASLLLAGAVIGTVVLFSGTYETSALRQHFRVTHWLLNKGLERSVRVSSADIVAPPLDSPALVETGLACYREHCTHCHGAPGIAPRTGATGVIPVPAGLAHTARTWSPERLYYLTTKGVRMTGMPAWEVRLSDESRWGIVAFLKVMPQLTADDYRTRLAEADVGCPQREDLPDIAPDELGDVLLRQYGCHACHLIDRVTGPENFSGPPLHAWPQRAYIAGTLPNTPENLALWIRDPQAISPQTLMPDLDVPPRHAEAMAAFLFSP